MSVAVAVAFFLASPSVGAKAVDREDVQIAEVRLAPFHDFVPARAEVAPLQTVFVDAVEGGRVERLVAADGSLVQPGAVLATLSNPQLQREVVAEEAGISGRISDVRGQLLQVQRSRADREREVEQARYELLQAERTRQTRQSLHAKSFVSDAELRIVMQEAEFRRTRLAALEAAARQEATMARRQEGEIQETLQRLEGNLSAVRRTLDALEIRVPVGGRLTAFQLQPGQTVKGGERVAQVDSEGAYKLIAQIDEFYLGRITPGQAATASHGGRTYRLRVERILPQVTNGRFQAEMSFVDAAPAAVRRGQSLEVEITLGATRPAVVVPNDPFMEASGGSWIFVVDANGKRAERRPIRTGRRNPQEVEVLSGLKPGERVVTSSYDAFTKHNRLILR